MKENMVWNLITDKSRLINSSLKILIKNKYLIVYIFYGITSLLIETIARIFVFNNINLLYSNYIPVLVGFIIMAYLNLKFNFNVPQKKYALSIFYFFSISIVSYSFQLFFATRFPNFLPENQYLSRFVISGLFFTVSYFLHTKSTFSSSVKIGYAIHPKNEMNLDTDSYDAIEYSDFIHIDLIDETYNPQNICNDTSVINKLISKLPNKSIQIHIMSKNPERYLNEIKYGNHDIFIHLDDLINFKDINSLTTEKSFGVVINTPILETEELKKIVEKYNKIMVLCIDHPGFSGQEFNRDYLKLIRKLDEIRLPKTEITIDGGVNELNVKHFPVEKIVSQSYLINGNNPVSRILNLKESNRYG